MILDGKLVSTKIKEDLKNECLKLKEEYKKVPSLAVVLVGDNKASEIYVNNKVKACQKVGINSIVKRLDSNVSTKEVLDEVKSLSNNNEIDGIIVQLPLPKQIDKDQVIEAINPKKDVDGLTRENVSKLVLDEDGFVPCTPKGVIDLLSYYNISLEGKNVCVIGRSMLVGKPLSYLLTNNNATVTLCHSKTKDLKKITRNSDIVVAAIGKANMITKDYIKKGTVVVDVGINRVEDKIYGDCHKDAYKKASYYTPVPGGCGPMTVAELLSNTVKAFKNNVKR